MDKELWLPVVDYEGIYEVSNYGGVRRVGGGTLRLAAKEQHKRHTVTAGNMQTVKQSGRSCKSGGRTRSAQGLQHSGQRLTHWRRPYNIMPRFALQKADRGYTMFSRARAHDYSNVFALGISEYP